MRHGIILAEAPYPAVPCGRKPQGYCNQEMKYRGHFSELAHDIFIVVNEVR